MAAVARKPLEPAAAKPSEMPASSALAPAPLVGSAIELLAALGVTVVSPVLVGRAGGAQQRRAVVSACAAHVSSPGCLTRLASPHTPTATFALLQHSSGAWQRACSLGGMRL
jgi:hypothetical protein